MKTKFRLTSAIFFFLLSPFVFPQGSLTPPGAPVPTMKTLDQVEPRTPIDAVHTPGDASNEFIISQAGSYYLTGSLNVGKTTGIGITAAGVTVDLNGFPITRTSGSAGVGLQSTGGNCTIKNGSVFGFSTGVFGGGRGGILSRLVVSNCSQAGISVGEGWHIDSCNVHDGTGTSSTGISAGSGSVISHSSAVANTGVGISIGDGATVVDCSAVGNLATAGINAGSGCTLTHCTARGNTSTGVNSAGIITASGCTITACTVHANTNTNGTPTTLSGAGIITGTRTVIQNCSIAFNKSDGINAADNCSIIANAANGNGNGGDGAGIHINGSNSRIEDNNVTGNDRGIDIDGTGNLIIKNSARGNTGSGTPSANFDIAASNSFGPIANVSGVGDISATANANHPWVNFSY
jgi:parallel beta-helix repeat protein